MSFLRQIQIFRSVMISSTLAEAAERLALTQPAVTKQVRNLERTIGCNLFARDGHRLQPNDRARALFEQSEPAVSGMQNLERFARNLQRDVPQTLRIMAMPMIARLWLPDRLPMLLANNPNTNFVIGVGQSGRIIDMLESGGTDIGIALPSRRAGVDRSERLITSNGVCIVPLDHPLADKKIIHPRDIANEDFFLLGPTAPTRNAILEVFQNCNVELKIRAEIDLEETAVALVESGAGVSVIDSFSATVRKKSGAQIKICTMEPTVEMHIDIMHSFNPSDPELVRSTFDFLKSKQ